MRTKTNKAKQNFKYIDNETFGNHIIMVYENEARGFAAKLRYLNNGLLKGEHAIFLTLDDPRVIENKMASFIDINKFHKKGLLHIIQVKGNMTDSQEAVKQFGKILKILESSADSGFRLTGPFIENTGDKIGKKLRLLIEKRCERFMSKHKGSILCPLPIAKVRNNSEKEWMCDMFKKHTDVLYLPKSGNGTSFNSDFML